MTIEARPEAMFSNLRAPSLGPAARAVTDRFANKRNAYWRFWLRMRSTLR
jgi:hypothetical protein